MTFVLVGYIYTLILFSLVLREPGAQGVDVDGPALSPDIAPLKFPGNN